MRGNNINMNSSAPSIEQPLLFKMCSYDLQHKYRVNYLQFPEELISIYRNTGEENTNYRGLQIHAKGEVHWKFFFGMKNFLK